MPDKIAVAGGCSVVRVRSQFISRNRLCVLAPCSLRRASDCLGYRIVGRVAPADIGKLDARIAMGCVWPGAFASLRCPSSALVARFVGIEARFRQHDVDVGDGNGAAGLGQAHQHRRHRGTREIAPLFSAAATSFTLRAWLSQFASSPYARRKTFRSSPAGRASKFPSRSRCRSASRPRNSPSSSQRRPRPFGF